MGFIYFIRHAQAGTRTNYDVLSEVGQEQARRLGAHLAAQGVGFEAIYAGSMRRQQHTAEIASLELARAGIRVPQLEIDTRWDEFSLASVYTSIARRLMEDSPQFARDVEEMQEALRQDPRSTRGATGRCDVAVIRAWMDNRYPDCEGETWAEFRDRVSASVTDLSARQDDDEIAIFTSATPIAIMTAAALELSQEKLISVLGVIYNSSITVMRPHQAGLRLFSFNATPHLSEEFRTLR